jgi:hypothetical protein
MQVGCGENHHQKARHQPEKKGDQAQHRGYLILSADFYLHRKVDKKLFRPD